MASNYYYGTGRRKTAVARVFIKTGSGKFVVNDKPVDEFFSRETGRMVVRQPLELTAHLTTFDIMVNVSGGGESGQAGAVPVDIEIVARSRGAQIVRERLDRDVSGLLMRDGDSVVIGVNDLHAARRQRFTNGPTVMSNAPPLRRAKSCAQTSTRHKSSLTRTHRPEPDDRDSRLSSLSSS